MFSRIRCLTECLCISLFLLNAIEVEPIRSNRAAESSQVTTSATQQVSKNATDIVLQNCKKYADLQYINKTNADCVNSTRNHYAEPKEYPHMAVIGYGEKFEDGNWRCSGFLISEKFILSLATCSQSTSTELGSAKWALLGAVVAKSQISDENDPQPAVYEIVKRHIHPSYDSKSRRNDIALFELNSTVTMSPYIRPACLYTQNSIPIGTKASVTGWNIEYDVFFPEIKQINFHLKKEFTLAVEDKICRTLTSTRRRIRNVKYDSRTMTCSGALLPTQNEICVLTSDFGSPLQIPVEGEPCMWNVVGITLLEATCEAENKEEFPLLGDPGVYVKVSYYQDWIQGIVWP